MSQEKIKVLIADDHPLILRGIKDVLEENNQVKIIGEAFDGEEAYKMTRELSPDILIIDIDMPKLNGLEVIKMIKKELPLIKIIVLTMYDKETIFNRAVDLGVSGYILKDSLVNEIFEAVKLVSIGKSYISPQISNFLIKRTIRMDYASEIISGISKLTPTERKILRLIAQNLTTKEIANELFISIKTVETHRNNICQKLGVHGTNALLRFALEHKEIL